MVAQDALGLHREPTLGGHDERTRATFQADQVSPSGLRVCAFQLNAFDLFRSVLFASTLRTQFDGESNAMPMIDIYAVAGTFANTKQLAIDAANTVKTIEGVPDIPMFRKNTAAFVHELPEGTLANVEGDENYVRVQVLTNEGALDREKQMAVVEQLTNLVSTAAGDETLKERTWVLLTEAKEGGWGLWGHAHTNKELVAAARDEIAKLKSASS
jgi:phenylpyruvate tautomerase PptA (4-oxalocrotonate tautomerase family)